MYTWNKQFIYYSESVMRLYNSLYSRDLNKQELREDKEQLRIP